MDTLKPADVNEMLDREETSVNTIIDQINLGRGKQWSVLFHFDDSFIQVDFQV